MSTELRRPPQVTSACLFVGLSCGMLLITLVEILTAWTSITVQDELGRVFDAIGVALTDGRVEGVRIGLQLLVVFFVAGIVCAVYASRRHAPSRIVMTGTAAVAGLGFLAFFDTFLGLLAAIFTGYALAQLWSPPANRWFAGKPEPRAEAAKSSRPDPFAARSPHPPVDQSRIDQPSVDLSSAPPPAAETRYAPVAAPPAPHPQVQRPPATGGVPSPVRTIDLVVSITAGLTALATGAYLALYLVAQDALVQTQLDSPFQSVMEQSEAEIVETTRASALLCAVALVLSLAALVAVRLYVRRARGGQLLLTILSGSTIGVGVLMIIGIPWAALAGWVLVLMQRPEAKAFTADRSR